MDEDCLTIDVWGPVTTEKADKLPVMVFLHGGSLVEGSILSIQTGYGSVKNMALVSAGVVSVSINYRLAVSGFLALDVLSKFDERGVSGNYGLLDTIEALRWVRDNIASFGGDPNTVTVYGQSSG